MAKETKSHTRDDHTYTYENEGATLSTNAPIDPISPVNELISEDYIKKIITADMLSIKAAKGKIPISDPNDPNGRLDNSWVGLTSSGDVYATTTIEGKVRFASQSELNDYNNSTTVVSPKDVRSLITNTYPQNASASQAGLVKLTSTINPGDTREDVAVTPKAVVSFLGSEGFSHASYDGFGITKYASWDKLSVIDKSDTNSKSYNLTDPNVSDVSVTPYMMYKYLSNANLNLNTRNKDGDNTKGYTAINFRTYDTASSSYQLKGRVGATSSGEVRIKSYTGQAIKLGQSESITGDYNSNRMITLIDASGNSNFPGTVTVADLQLGTQNIGDTSTPVYVKSGKIVKCDGLSSAYLPLSGGDMTGDVTFNSSTLYFRNNNTTQDPNGELSTQIEGNSGSNDFWRIASGYEPYTAAGTDSGHGFLEIAVSDDGNEPIYVRQYGGGKTNSWLPENIARTATILDSTGNTEFPGTVTMSGFKLGTQNIGSSSTPVYIKNGSITACNLTDLFKEMMKKLYPVGAIYISTDNTNPATLFGFGTWEKIEGRFILGSSSTYAVNKTGGSETVTLTTDQIPSHSHTVTINNGGSHSHKGTAANGGSHSHTGSSDNTGAHTHTRGSMDITGSFDATDNSGWDEYATGAFSVESIGSGDEGNHGGELKRYTLTASNAWTGATSSSGAHKHTITINDGGSHSHTITVNSGGSHSHTGTVGSSGSGKGHSNMPPYYAANIWRRTK